MSKSLHIESSGHGPDLVLLHGWGTGRGVWADLARGLATRFRVHAVDLPGYGNSPACVPYTAQRTVELLAATFPSPLTVCGWSLGGQLALQWALEHPAQVRQLVLISATPCFAAAPGWPHGTPPAVLADFARELAADPEAALLRFAALQAQGDGEAQRVLRLLRALPQAVVGAELAATLEWLRDTDLRARLPYLTQPALVMHGDRDAVTPWAAGAALALALPAARRVTLHGAGHAPFLSQPETCLRQILHLA